MKFTRVLTATKPDDVSVADWIKWKTVDVLVSGKDGEAIFEQSAVEVPEQWSQNASNILASKYFRKAGVPSHTVEVFGYDNLPGWLRPMAAIRDAGEGFESPTGGETSARQVFHRLAGCWTYWGWREGYFSSEDDARVFYDEAYACLALQVAAPASPQWFNTGLWWAHGIEGPDSGMWRVCTDYPGFSPETPRPLRVHNSYEYPQPHACFLSSVSDDLVNEGGIMDLWVREARIFKHGSGSGINPSRLRAKGEPLSGGGYASGLMSWLEIGDRAAGSIHSGGTTRRAAKMVCLDADHPEIIEFVNWKVCEEAKAAAMYVGSQLMKRCWEFSDEVDLPDVIPDQFFDRAKVGIEPEVFGVDWEGEAIRTVSGQNSNNSVRVTDEFMRRVEGNEVWQLFNRTDQTVNKTVQAPGLWDQMCRAAWACADPGLVFHDTVNSWNTCSADGEIRTTNPCAEFMHLDGSACNLASLRLTAFLREDGSIDLDLYQHACRLWATVLDISNSMASFPAKEFAVGSYNYRTVGLGYADLGGLLMRMAIPYASDDGRALAAGLTALMTGVAYLTSAEMARELGPFPRWSANSESMRRVLNNHRVALFPEPSFDGLNVEPSGIDAFQMDKSLRAAALSVWNKVCLHGQSFRNAQVTNIAPTGTISFVMDCDTTGIEPDFALVKYKSLAGGGSMRIVNQAVASALRRLGYDRESIERVLGGIEEHGSFPPVPRWLEKLAGDKLGDHLAVFACANDIDPDDHVRMVAAVQPFLSGGVSKTINMPRDATVDGVSRVYKLAHRLGLKAVALYRDGSKLSQPMRAAESVRGARERAQAIKTPEISSNALGQVGSGEISPMRTTAADPEVLKLFPDGRIPMPEALLRGEREYLPWRRTRGFTQKVKIGQDGQSVYLRVSEYPDGRPGEVFLELAHEGSTLRALANCLAISISVGLQRGVPVAEYVDQFVGTKFEPAGYVEGHDRIRFASSIADYIGRELGINYAGRDDLANSPMPIAEAVERIAEASQVADEQQRGYLRDQIVAYVSAEEKRHNQAVSLSSKWQPTGDYCPSCGELLRRNGTCRSCPNCGYDEGCSG